MDSFGDYSTTVDFEARRRPRRRTVARKTTTRRKVHRGKGSVAFKAFCASFRRLSKHRGSATGVRRKRRVSTRRRM